MPMNWSNRRDCRRCCSLYVKFPVDGPPSPVYVKFPVDCPLCMSSFQLKEGSTEVLSKELGLQGVSILKNGRFHKLKLDNTTSGNFLR
ncbi:hypothetical protein J6590_008807 [Homalodisca vitripennis]|nr:hypothetical protein J6590_008807 [Homalodisca vitripennis]